MNLLSDHPLLIAAVKPGADMEWFIQQSFSMAKKLDAEIVFVQIIDPVNEAYLQTVFDIPAINTKISQQIDDDRVKQFHNDLEKVVQKYKSNHNLSYRVVVDLMIGDFSDSLDAFVKKFKAACVMIGSKNSYNFAESTMSKSIGIMDKLETPVIIIPKDVSLKDGDRVKVMLCDDLTDKSQVPLNFARNLSRTHPNISIQHVNVVDLHEFDDGRWLDIGKKNGVDSKDQLIKKLHDRVTSNLMDRFSFGLSEADLESVSYEARCYTGDTKEQLSSAAKSLDADMIVVGDHKLLKLTPFGRGRLSWSDMATLGSPVLIIKDRL